MSISPASIRAPRKWSPAENSLLQEKVEECKKAGRPIFWPEIAAAFQNRSKDDCRKRWAKMDEKWRRGAWDSSEDELLRQAVKECGLRWTDISKKVGTRSADQCAKHWRNLLDPNNSRGEWTSDDDTILVESVKRYGHDWKQIRERFFPDRSRLDLSNRHVTLGRQERRKKISLSNHSRPNQAPVESCQMTDTSTGNTKEQFEPLAPALGGTSTPHQDIATWAPEVFNAPPTGILNSQTIDAIFEHFDADDSKRENELHPPLCFYRDNINEDNDILMSNLSFSSLPELDESQRSALTFSPATSSDAPSILMHDRPSMTCESTMAIEGQDPATPSSLHELTITKKGKTVLTVEDLDPETRGEILNLLCQRKLITTIEIV